MESRGFFLSLHCGNVFMLSLLLSSEERMGESPSHWSQAGCWIKSGCWEERTCLFAESQVSGDIPVQPLAELLEAKLRAGRCPCHYLCLTKTEDLGWWAHTEQGCSTSTWLEGSLIPSLCIFHLQQMWCWGDTLFCSILFFILTSLPHFGRSCARICFTRLMAVGRSSQPDRSSSHKTEKAFHSWYFLAL